MIRYKKTINIYSGGLQRVTDNDSEILSNSINISKVNFKVDAYHSASANDMYKGWLDVFSNDDNIDYDLSSNWLLNPTLKIVSSVIGEGTLDPTCIGLWHMNEITEENLVIDSSLSGFNGLVTNGIVEPAKYFNGIKLDNGLVNFGHGIGDLLGTPNEYSLSIWFKCSEGGYNELFNIVQDVPGEYPPSVFNIGTNYIGMYFHGGGSADFSYPYPEFNIIHHLVLTHKVSTNERKIFIDNVLIHQSLALVSPNTFSNTNTFLGYPHLSTRCNATIDDLSIYSKALTVEEVDAIYNSVIELGAPSAPAIVITKSHAAEVSPDSVLLVVEGDSGLIYEVSRNNGLNWLQINNNQVNDISSLPTGTEIRLRITIPIGETLDNISLWW